MPEKNGQQMDAEQKMRHWIGKIPGYVKELFTPERFPHLLDVMLQYSKYGFDNAVLIAAQCREKELALADRGIWEKKYGRHVTDGAEGIQVIVPTRKRKRMRGRKPSLGQKSRRLGWMEKQNCSRRGTQFHGCMSILCTMYRRRRGGRCRSALSAKCRQMRITLIFLLKPSLHCRLCR